MLDVQFELEKDPEEFFEQVQELDFVKFNKQNFYDLKAPLSERINQDTLSFLSKIPVKQEDGPLSE